MCHYRQPCSKCQLLDSRLIGHPNHMDKACEQHGIVNPHELGLTCRRTRLRRQAEDAVRSPEHAGGLTFM
eukprot:364009-Chlamydomonas_euryale.AAC.9